MDSSPIIVSIKEKLKSQLRRVGNTLLYFKSDVVESLKLRLCKSYIYSLYKISLLNSNYIDFGSNTSSNGRTQMTQRCVCLS